MHKLSGILHAISTQCMRSAKREQNEHQTNGKVHENILYKENLNKNCTYDTRFRRLLRLSSLRDRGTGVRIR